MLIIGLLTMYAPLRNRFGSDGAAAPWERRLTPVCRAHSSCQSLAT